jgi:Tfp pilus assembly protein PilF
MNSNRLNEAEIYLLNENKVNPTYDNAYFNLGILYLKKGDIMSATEYMMKTISINPGYVDAYKYLINIYQSVCQGLVYIY